MRQKNSCSVFIRRDPFEWWRHHTSTYINKHDSTRESDTHRSTVVRSWNSKSFECPILRDRKMLTQVTIWQGNFVWTLMHLAHVKWQSVIMKDFHCIPSCSFNLRRMTSKTYHSVAGNMAYKTIHSLLLSHPPRRINTSLPPTLSLPSCWFKRCVLSVEIVFSWSHMCHEAEKMYFCTWY